MKKQLCSFENLMLLVVFLCVCSNHAASQKNSIKTSSQQDVFDPDNYNVSWTSPSYDGKGSMPIGNGDLAANVWVEPNGELKLLLSKSDAFDEFNRLLKLGIVHIRTTPSLLTGNDFVQTLHLKNGWIEIKTSLVDVTIWADVNQSEIQIDIRAAKAIQVEAWTESWRKNPRILGAKESHSAYGNRDEDKRVNPDSVLSHGNNFVAICHRNIESIWKKNLILTGLGSEIQNSHDPLLNRTFGLFVWSKDLRADNDSMLASRTSLQNISLKIISFTQFTHSCSEWLKQVTVEKNKLEKNTDDYRFLVHKNWWQEYWNRSWIEVTGRNGFDSAAWKISQLYVLQRYINACAGKGALPIKFNGSLFTVSDGFDPDYRAWGGCYWWQNTRLPYWSMLYSGDYDLIKPLFDMYYKALPLRKAAAKKYYGHGGAFFPETMNFWGNYSDVNYGIDRSNIEDGLVQNAYIRRYWQSGIELSTLMLGYYEAVQNKKFATDTLIPFANEIIRFYDEHWKRNSSGTIIFSPAQSLETWQEAVDPTPDIAGLHSLLSRLIELEIAKPEKKYWQRVLNSLPSVPVEQKGGETYLLPAREYSKRNNVENCELYAVFPYRLYTDLSDSNNFKIGLSTWKRRMQKDDFGWQQNCIQAALLGLANEAQDMIVKRAYRKADGYRFPAFFGPNYDWTPDQDHPSCMLIALQRMIMQCEGKKIALAPAWPGNWNINFKLAAPLKTTVRGRIQNGKLIHYDVSPTERRRDVVVMVIQ